MKKLFSSAILALFLIQSIFAQEKPLTQAEYVKMLYALQKNPVEKQELIESVRRRGINFVLTDGLRGLTRSKSGNDEELKRTLEEAERRRQNPTEAKLPSAKEAAEILERTRMNTLAAVEEMPDFVVKQLISRSVAYAGTNNFRNLDRLIVAASFRSDGYEEYKILSINGIKQVKEKGEYTYSESGGASTTGEFASIIASIFKKDNETRFELIGGDILIGRKSIIFGFEISRDKLKRIVAFGDKLGERITTGFKGKVWIDTGKFRVLRVETEATEIPSDLPLKSIKRFINYDWVSINNEQYLLPSLSEIRFTDRFGDKTFESRNLIRFKDYQKFGTEVIILDDDNAPIQEEKP
jgi:hypothetical protein